MKVGELPDTPLPEDLLEIRLRAARAHVTALSRGLLIDGSWREPQSERIFRIEDPALASMIAEVDMAGPIDVDLAVCAANAAVTTGAWSRMNARERMRILMQWADLIEAVRDEVVLLETLDTGGIFNTIKSTDFEMALNALREAASWAGKVSGEMPMTQRGANALAFSSREPVGVVGVITPWNAPLLMALKKMAAALAAGCSVVFKPSELTPLSALRLGSLAQEAGFPPGALNILPGDGSIGAAMVDHKNIHMISFTGSTKVGRAIVAASAAGNLKRFVLELGGKSPVLVLPDADPARAADAIVREITFKSGQYCAAGTRVYVARSIYPVVLEHMISALANLCLGHGLNPATHLGPLISAGQRDRVQAMLHDASQQGVETLWEGKAAKLPGHFQPPMLLGGTHAGMAIHDEEVFGPVLCVEPVGDDLGDEALAMLANDSRYGLAAKIWTENLARALRIARLIGAGTITINGGGGESGLPFGGFKESGMGRENGREGVLAHTEIKTVRMAI